MHYVATRMRKHTLNEGTFTTFRLKDLLCVPLSYPRRKAHHISTSGPVRLKENLDVDTITILVDNGLDQQCSTACREWRTGRSRIESSYQTSFTLEMDQASQRLELQRPDIETCLRVALAEHIQTNFP